MQCERCQERPAAVLITKILNGKKTEARLCEVCAQQENNFAIQMDPKMILHNFFADFFKAGNPGMGQLKVTKEPGAKCEKCGFTDAHFTKAGKLGCNDCYKTFGEKIDPLLRRIHGNVRHTGKLPQRRGGKLKIRQELDSLRNLLQKAVAKEEYEVAAQLRDKIRELELSVKGGGTDGHKTGSQ